LTAKNAVGAFWQPDAVVCDVAYLRTEPPRGYRSALAEVVKTALIGDPDLLELVETSAEAAAQGDLAVAEEMVRRSIRVKARVVSQDEREGGLRACLNLGHTLGHALESQGGYTQLSHGEAVSLGLVLALRLGERLGVTPAAITSRVTRLLTRLGLPTETTPAALLDAAKLIGHDKKRSGSGLRFVLVENVGAVCTRRMELSELEAQVRVLAAG
jgi:shikimate kinase/3-dehydroquinate synthase